MATTESSTRTIEFVDQTLRDGPQSWWGMRMRADMALPIAPELDAIGYRTIDLTGSSIFEVLVRYCREDPWETLRRLAAKIRHTPLRAGTRSNGIVTFGLTADSVMDLWIRRLCANGIRSFWIYDGLFNMDKIGRLTTVAHSEGAEAVGCILYADSPYHSDEYYAARTREFVAAGVDGIELEDAAGVLTPERTRTLVTAIRANANGLPMEIHFHSNTGLAPLCYLEGIRQGADTIHTAHRPLAAGPSLPSIEAMLANVRYTGWNAELDEARFKDVEQHLLRVAEVEGLPVGHAAEYELFQYRHQLPGGMTGTLKNQLRQHGMEDRLDAVLDEMSRVREEFGYPVMATPFSQLVGTQAVLNIVTGERYKVVPNEVLIYVNGYYGPSPGPIDENVRDKVLSAPEAKNYAEWAPPQPTLEDLRRTFGESLSDDDLLLRLLVPEEDIVAMRAHPPSNRDYSMTSSQAAFIRQMIEIAVGAYMHIQIDELSLTLHGRPS